MYLKHLQLIHFKNYESIEIELNNRINCFVGENGAGKTNLIDAIHYLSMCKSFLNTVDRQNILFNQKFLSINGVFSKEEKDFSIQCAIKIGTSKVFKKNKVSYEKLADHIGLFPSVVISPYDKDLITEGSELRRKLLDGIISQSDRHYLFTVQKYLKVLTQRNALLKNMAEKRLFEQESIEMWNEQLVQLGEEIHKKRQDFMQDFIPVFNKYYKQVGTSNEDVSISYKSQLNDKSFEILLKESIQKDLHSHYSNVGIHKDDLIFKIKDMPIKKFGSQGQQKSMIIALRLAQYEWLKNKLGTKPMLLLDDIFDKLDNKRVQRLIELVSTDYFGQVFVTDTEENRIIDTLKQNQLSGSIFNIYQGEINKIPEATLQIS